MQAKISIRKVLMAAAWLAIGISLLTLLIAANRREMGHECKDIAITIRGVGESFYVDKNDISAALKKEAGGDLVQQQLKSINLAKLEQVLEKNPWIKDAEIYFDSRNVLHVLVTERQPVARVFTTAGNSFYIDTGALRMPLLDEVSIRVPVVTNFPAAKRLNKKDSVLLNDVKLLAQFVTKDEFWNAQVAQIDIIDRKYFEIIPTIGSHIIHFGTAENLEDKFHRLLVFYRQVLSKTGFDKYSALDAQYDGQIIGVHKGSVSSVDSVQLQKNIEELLEKSRITAEEQRPMKIDSANNPLMTFIQETNDSSKAKEIEEPSATKPSNKGKTTDTKPTLTPKKTTTSKKPDDKKKPKAVMARPT